MSFTGATLSGIKETSENPRSNSDAVARLADGQSSSVQQAHVSREQIDLARYQPEAGRPLLRAPGMRVAHSPEP